MLPIVLRAIGVSPSDDWSRDLLRLIRGRPLTAAAWLFALVLLLRGTATMAGGGPLGIDHRIEYDDGGIWARKNQDALIEVLLVGEVGGALWEGGEDRFGRTLWQSIDATVIGAVTSQALKYAFSRERPSTTSDPNQWFKGHGNQSFPSGEVTVVSSIVTPLVLEYRHDTPVVYALELLPVYDAVARMKVQAHWQSDVIAGFAIGTAAGLLAHGHAGTPWVLSVMPHGIYVGWKKQF
jgi:undecaprenyl-diphosphatase